MSVLSPLSAPWRGNVTRLPFEKWIRAAGLLFYLGVIFYVSSIPGQVLGQPVDDRIAHSTEYFGLNLVLLATIAGFVGRLAPRHLLLSVVACFLYGISDELHQRFVPNRFSDPKDVLFDTIGATVAALLVWWLKRERRP